MPAIGAKFQAWGKSRQATPKQIKMIEMISFVLLFILICRITYIHATHNVERITIY